MKRKDDPESLQEQDLRTEDMRLCALHHKWLKELFVAIRGNGDIKHGLEWKVQTLLDNQNTIKKISWVIASAVVLNAAKVLGEPILKWGIHLVHEYWR